MEKVAEALEEVLDVVDLALRSRDLLHKRHQLLSEQDVVESHEGDLVLHAVDDQAHELLLLEEGASIPDDLLEVVLLLGGELLAVKLPFEEHHAQQVQ